MSRLGRSQPVQPFVSHGFLGNTPANGVLPGQILVVENDDRRRKTPPLQPVILGSVYATVTTPVVVTPAKITVIDRVDARARYLPQPVIVQHGPAPMLYFDSGTGTLTLSGSSTEALTHSPSGSGTITLSGTGTVTHTFGDSGAGTITLSGASSESQTHAVSGAGTITLSGSGSETYTPPGGVVFTFVSNAAVFLLRRRN